MFAALAALVLTLAGAVAQAQSYPDLIVNLHDVDDDRREPLTKAAHEAARAVQAYLQVPKPATVTIDFVGGDDAFAQVMARHQVTGWDERWLAGLAMLDQNRVIVAVNGTHALTTRDTLEHELVHVLMHGAIGHQRQPRWYQEGAAMLLAGEATWERMKAMAGAAPLGQLDSLNDLDDGLLGSSVEKERAYATAGAFLQFATRRTGVDRLAVAEVQRHMAAGMAFDRAFTLTFGRTPDDLYRIFAEHMQATASAWSLLLTDSAMWSIVSLLSAIALVHRWRNRAKYVDLPQESSGPPVDLEEVAALSEAAAQRPWRNRDFSSDPLSLNGVSTPQVVQDPIDAAPEFSPVQSQNDQEDSQPAEGIQSVSPIDQSPSLQANLLVDDERKPDL